MNDLPIATHQVPNAFPGLPSQVALSVALVTTGNKKGTGWLVSDRHIITAEHVVQGSSVDSVLVRFSDATEVHCRDVIVDPQTDLAAIVLLQPVPYAPLSVNADIPGIGTCICAWGHPLGYNGPLPILCVGYVAGLNDYQHPGLAPQRRLVLNAALNPGNSGGPVFAWGEQSVRGVAISKHAPIARHLQQAIDDLKSNESGIGFTTTDSQGNMRQVVESQVVAEVLLYFREMTQVVIGEAVAAGDVIAFLDKNKVPWQKAT